MDIEKTTKVKLSKEDITSIIKDYLFSQGLHAKDLTFKINKKQWTEGCGVTEMDYEELIFEGIEANVE